MYNPLLWHSKSNTLYMHTLCLFVTIKSEMFGEILDYNTNCIRK